MYQYAVEGVIEYNEMHLTYRVDPRSAGRGHEEIRGKVVTLAHTARWKPEPVTMDAQQVSFNHGLSSKTISP